MRKLETTVLPGNKCNKKNVLTCKRFRAFLLSRRIYREVFLKYWDIDSKAKNSSFRSYATIELCSFGGNILITRRVTQSSGEQFITRFFISGKVGENTEGRKMFCSLF